MIAAMWRWGLRLVQWTGVVCAVWAAPPGKAAVLASIGVVAVMVSSKVLGAMAYEAGREGTGQ